MGFLDDDKKEKLNTQSKEEKILIFLDFLKENEDDVKMKMKIK